MGSLNILLVIIKLLLNTLLAGSSSPVTPSDFSPTIILQDMNKKSIIIFTLDSLIFYQHHLWKAGILWKNSVCFQNDLSHSYVISHPPLISFLLLYLKILEIKMYDSYEQS